MPRSASHEPRPQETRDQSLGDQKLRTRDISAKQEDASQLETLVQRETLRDDKGLIEGHLEELEGARPS